MKLYRPAKVEWISFLTLMPLIGIALAYLMYGGRILDHGVLLNTVPLYLLIGLPYWYVHVWLVNLVQQKYPLYEQMYQRNVRHTLVHFLIIGSSVSTQFVVFHYFHILGYNLEVLPLLVAIGIILIITFIATLSWYTRYAMQKWMDSLAEKEKLQQENLRTEFESLKHQVNPHFLFNSLNSLSALIEEDPDRAEAFVNEMSKVYRYLLRNNEDGFLTTLSEELQFIHSYYHLLKARYTDSITLQVNVNKEYMHYMIPPLTLQLLVENAVKHNNILKDSPLKIHISAVNSKLTVSNNLQKKNTVFNSSKLGLNNIRDKYQLLNQEKVSISEDANTFSVCVPLINPA